MSERKGWGSTVVGWFVVQEPRPGEEMDEVVEEYAQSEPAAEFHPETVFKSAPPAAPQGNVDFEGVFEAAGIDGEERSRVAKSVELLRSLPADTEPRVKKQIVEASLRAFGVPINQIIEAGVEEIQALEGYIRAGASDTEKLISESERRIQQFEEEVRKIRTVMQDRVTEQHAVVKKCNEKKLEIQQILEFFGQEKVAQVVKESPKLIDPSIRTPGRPDDRTPRNS